MCFSVYVDELSNSSVNYGTGWRVDGLRLITTLSRWMTTTRHPLFSHLLMKSTTNFNIIIFWVFRDKWNKFVSLPRTYMANGNLRKNLWGPNNLQGNLFSHLQNFTSSTIIQSTAYIIMSTYSNNPILLLMLFLQDFSHVGPTLEPSQRTARRCQQWRG